MEENVSAKDVLLKWAQKSTAKYPGVSVANFTNSWRDGLAFNAIIHRNRPDLIDWRSVQRRSTRERLENAFTVAERDCGVTRLLDAEGKNPFNVTLQCKLNQKWHTSCINNHTTQSFLSLTSKHTTIINNIDSRFSSY